MSFLQIEGLRKTYADGTHAVKGVDIDANEGEFIVLLGPSGCGKTTTLRMIAGLETPTAGRILLEGNDIVLLRPGQRDVGFVFQFYALYPHLTVAANIAFPLENAGIGKEECRARVHAIARQTGLEALLDLFPGQLSGGDQQRVALARAMVRRPRLYLMDEPIGTLDAGLRLVLREFIREQQSETHVTTFYVTHDQEEAMALADRIVVVRDGEIRQMGEPEEVYERPADLFVAHFVGSPGMNLMDGALIEEGGERFLAGPGGTRLAFPAFAEGVRGAVTWGIRPEYLLVKDDGPLTGTVVLTEYLGARRYVYADTGWGRVVALANTTAALPPGASIALRPDPAHLRLFDPATGKAVGA
ncbi:MAG: ABC transporter ATP-binding protein [candidate division Zixibacteria bacterium]|nr:ABC transporter ATP-binding protein [candidate division Zixibacteria bacterium]